MLILCNNGNVSVQKDEGYDVIARNVPCKKNVVISRKLCHNNEKYLVITLPGSL